MAADAMVRALLARTLGRQLSREVGAVIKEDGASIDIVVHPEGKEGKIERKAHFVQDPQSLLQLLPTGEPVLVIGPCRTLDAASGGLHWSGDLPEQLKKKNPDAVFLAFTSRPSAEVFGNLFIDGIVPKQLTPPEPCGALIRILRSPARLTPTSLFVRHRADIIRNTSRI